MFKNEKLCTIFLGAATACLVISCGVDIYSIIPHSSALPSNSNDSSVSEPLGTTSGNSINVEDYVTYFDLAYAAYTKPKEFLDKELTLVGYYSSSKALEEPNTSGTSSSTGTSSATDASSSAETSSTANTSKDSDKVYHFLTAYGQIDECHITVEFTTADNKYPEVGTVIKITGKFTSYEEDGQTYYTIAADNYTTVNV